MISWLSFFICGYFILTKSICLSAGLIFIWFSYHKLFWFGTLFSISSSEPGQPKSYSSHQGSTDKEKFENFEPDQTRTKKIKNLGPISTGQSPDLAARGSLNLTRIDIYSTPYYHNIHIIIIKMKKSEITDHVSCRMLSISDGFYLRYCNTWHVSHDLRVCN